MRSIWFVLLLPSLALARPVSGFLDHPETRHVRLLDASLESDLPLAQPAPVRLFDASHLAMPLGPLEFSAATHGGDKPIIALLLGLIVGFGTGHLIAGDQHGFVLFLIVDVAIIATSVILASTVSHGFFALTGVGLLVSHIFQGLQAYGEAGGEKIVEDTRARAVEIAQGPGSDGPVTTRSFGFSF